MTRKILVTVLCCLTLAVAFNSAAAVLLWSGQQKQVTQNCLRIHRLAKVGGEIILAGKRDLAEFYMEETITRDQYARGIKQIDLRYRRWAASDCKP